MPTASQRITDRNGWVEVRGNPISKAGVFDYLGREIKREPGQPPLDPDKIYKVLRPAEELARDETINSFKLLPFVDDHTVLGIDGIPAETKGIQGTIGEQVYFDAPYLRGNIKIHSDTALSQINAGKVELSPAYYCDWPEEGGTFDGQPYQFTQRNIIGNHLALVSEGRTGADVAVQDSKVVQDSKIVVNDRSMKITLDSAELIKMADPKDDVAKDEGAAFSPEQMEALKAMMQEMMAGSVATADADPVADPAADVEPAVTEGQEDAAQETVAAATEAETALEDAAAALAEVSAAAEQVVATDSKDKVKLQAAKTKLATAKVKAAQKQKIATDSMAALKALRNRGSIAADQAIIKELREKVAKLESGASVAMDSNKFLGEIADRNDLASKLSNFTGSFDHSRMTLDAVAEYGIKKLGLTAPKGSERIALDAWMHGRKPAHEEIIIAADGKPAPSLDDAWAKQAEGK